MQHPPSFKFHPSCSTLHSSSSILHVSLSILCVPPSTLQIPPSILYTPSISFNAVTLIISWMSSLIFNLFCRGNDSSKQQKEWDTSELNCCPDISPWAGGVRRRSPRGQCGPCCELNTCRNYQTSPHQALGGTWGWVFSPRNIGVKIRNIGRPSRKNMRLLFSSCTAQKNNPCCLSISAPGEITHRQHGKQVFPPKNCVSPGRSPLQLAVSSGFTAVTWETVITGL